jgi:hypothetical protein
MISSANFFLYFITLFLCVNSNDIVVAPTFSEDFVPLLIKLRESGEGRARYIPRAGTSLDNSLRVSCRFVYYADRSPSSLIEDEEENALTTEEDDETETETENDESLTSSNIVDNDEAAALSKSLLEKRDGPHPAVVQLALITGQCVDGNNKDGFDYTICVGTTVRQRPTSSSKGGVFDMDLGSFNEEDRDRRVLKPLVKKEASALETLFAAWTGPQTQLYSRGRFCVKTERKSTGTYFCGKEFAVVWVAEIESCVYAFAVTHPSLCKDTTLFPLWSIDMERSLISLSQNKGSSSGLGFSSQKDGKMSPDERADSLLNALAPVARLRLTRKRQEIAKLLKDEERLRDATSTMRLDTEDVAGVGGGSIGRDDHERHGSKWTGLDKILNAAATDASMNNNYSASWALDVHPAWPIDEHAKNPSKSSWTCIALGTDDLRRGGSGGARSSSNAPLPARRVALNLVIEGVAPGLNSAVVSATARGTNRQLVPNEIVHRAESAKGKHSVILTLQTNDESSESLDVAFLSVSLDIAVEED